MLEIIIEAYRWFFLQLAGVVGLGWGIVALSFITSAAMMPLMKLVAGIVRSETEYQSVILPQIADINKRYATDMDRNLHIQRLYARYAYSPLSAVKKVLPLFIQIPFLLLTYFMLKDTAQLSGVPFLFLRDLGQPDGLLAVLGINILPIVMTGVNILTVFATPSFTTRDWTQAIGIALLFLIMLYTAPSALLLYWTLNNVVTMFRTLLSKRSEGAKLLWSRICGMRKMLPYIRAKSTDRNKTFAALVLILVSLYMRLMVYMEVWFFNRFASYWLMNEVLAVALVIVAIEKRKDVKIVRWLAAISAVLSSVVALSVFSALVALPFTPKLMMIINQHWDLAKIFDRLFLLSMLPVVLGVLFEIRVVVRAIRIGFAKSSYWLVVIAILAVHYSFASHNFKLPIDSVCLLTLYLTIPAIVISVYCVMFAYRHISADMLFKISIGISLGAYLIPMVSIEEGKILGYGSNLLIRLALMCAMAWLIVRIKQRKPVLVFLSCLGLLVIANAAVAKYRVTEEMESKKEATAGSEAQRELLNAPSSHTNSIYFLVYDGYAHDIVLEGMGIKSIGLRNYLNQRGFVSYDTYSVGSDTVVSMGNTFNIGGVVQGSLRSSMAGNNVFCDYLRRYGYKSAYVLCGYDMPKRGERMPGDFYFPTAQKMPSPELVLYPCIVRGILSQSANTFNSYTREEWLSVKRDLMRKADSTCSFIYAHSEKPGHVAANPAYRKSPEEERLGYEARVYSADMEIQEDINMLLSKNDNSIIIVASDHGSLLSLPEHDSEYDAFTMLDRVGVQLHIRWPNDYMPTLQLTCLQNLFLEIEIYLSGDTSLARFALPGESLRIPAPIRAPEGAIVDGVIKVGAEKQQNLFEAAKSILKKVARR